MDFRLITIPETTVYGLSKSFDKPEHPTRETLRHSVWSEDCDDFPGKIAAGRWNQPGSTAYDGVWYGLWQDGRYMIARENPGTTTDNLEVCKIPAGTYAAFKTEHGGLAWEEFPKLFELIFDSWLPTSGFQHQEEPIIEVYHLWTDHDVRSKNRYFEVWIPVKKK